jgi:hypothetical protein
MRQGGQQCQNTNRDVNRGSKAISQNVSRENEQCLIRNEENTQTIFARSSLPAKRRGQK